MDLNFLQLLHLAEIPDSINRGFCTTNSTKDNVVVLHSGSVQLQLPRNILLRALQGYLLLHLRIEDIVARIVDLKDS